MGRRTLFIISPEAGRDTPARWRRFEFELKRRGYAFDRVIAARPGHPLELATEMASRYDLLVAVGGDGTVYEVINGIMSGGRPHPALTILPFGTGNDSAACAGIGDEMDTLSALTLGTPRAIDLIEIQCQVGGASCGRFAMLFASVGITGDLLRYTTPRLKALCGRRLAYIAALLLALRKHDAGHMKITCDRVSRKGRYVLACASNAPTFGGGIRIAPDARVDDGWLNVNLIESVGRWEALRHLQRLRQGRHTDHPKVYYKPANTLTVETSPPVDVAADGDLIGHTPAVFTVRPAALRILTPNQRA